MSLPKDRMTGRPRGFGFVTLATPQEAQAARDALDGSMQAGKSISVRPFQAEPPRRDGPGAGPRMGGDRAEPADRRPMGGGALAPDRTLYVGNLPYDATVEEVQTLVNRPSQTAVVRVHLPMDADGRKRGFGFVTMASAEAAKTADRGRCGGGHCGRRLVVNLAHPKGERPSGGGSGAAAATAAAAAASRRGPVPAGAAFRGASRRRGGGNSARPPPRGRKTFDESAAARPRRRRPKGRARPAPPAASAATDKDSSTTATTTTTSRIARTRPARCATPRRSGPSDRALPRLPRSRDVCRPPEFALGDAHA